MPKARNQKEMLLDQYRALLSESKGYIAVQADKVNNLTVTDLKKKLKAVNGNYVVVKNTIFKIALQEQNKPLPATDFEGQTAVVIYNDDPTEIAKILKETQKKSELLQARYGVIEGDFISGAEVMTLAEIPSRNELIAKLLGSLNAPLSGIMNVFTGNVRGFVQIISKLSEK